MSDCSPNDDARVTKVVRGQRAAPHLSGGQKGLRAKIRRGAHMEKLRAFKATFGAAYDNCINL
jgi:hypothetical protein